MSSTSWFGWSINYRLETKDPRDCHGSQSNKDFDSYRELASAVHGQLKRFSCPICGCHKVSGVGLIVDCGKVRLYESVAVKSWFGRTKYKDKLIKKVWRIHDYRLFTAAGRHVFNFFALLDSAPGQLKCNAAGCNWSASGGRHGTQTLGEFLGRLNPS